MRHKFLCSFIYLPILMLLLASCSNDARFAKSEQNVLEQKVYVTPENFNGVVHIFYSVLKNIYLEPNETVKFTTEFTLNNEILDADQAVSYYQSTLWNINGETITIPNFRYTFREPGKNVCTLQTVDLFGDTLFDTVNVYVNTPTHISLTSPRDGFNQVNRAFADTLVLKWDIQGLDPWETAKCTVYGSSNKKTVWETPLGEADCNESINLIGTSYEEILNTLPADYSETYYWGVVLKVSNENELNEIDTSSIFSFSTKILDSTKAILNIPIVYEKMSIFDEPITKITITNVSGDTIIQKMSYSKEDYVSIFLDPQTSIKVHLENELQPEFKADDFTINLPAQTNVVADTVRFEDKTPPTIWPVAMSKSTSASFKFMLIDKGSGINPYKIHIYKNGTEEVDASYNDTLLTIPNFKDSTYTISIIAHDKAGNFNSSTYWKVETDYPNQLHYLTGPFSDREEFE